MAGMTAGQSGRAFRGGRGQAGSGPLASRQPGRTGFADRHAPHCGRASPGRRSAGDHPGNRSHTGFAVALTHISRWASRANDLGLWATSRCPLAAEVRTPLITRRVCTRSKPLKDNSMGQVRSHTRKENTPREGGKRAQCPGVRQGPEVRRARPGPGERRGPSRALPPLDAGTRENQSRA